MQTHFDVSVPDDLKKSVMAQGELAHNEQESIRFKPKPVCLYIYYVICNKESIRFKHKPVCLYMSYVIYVTKKVVSFIHVYFSFHNIFCCKGVIKLLSLERVRYIVD